jgi:hypothetical protein
LYIFLSPHQDRRAAAAKAAAARGEQRKCTAIEEARNRGEDVVVTGSGGDDDVSFDAVDGDDANAVATIPLNTLRDVGSALLL